MTFVRGPISGLISASLPTEMIRLPITAMEPAFGRAVAIVRTLALLTTRSTAIDCESADWETIRIRMNMPAKDLIKVLIERKSKVERSHQDRKSTRLNSSHLVISY